MPFSPQLTLVRSRTQSTAVYIARLTATATFAYFVATLVPEGTSRPVLAPLTALFVMQASLYQTIRSGIRTVIAAVAGVVVAIGVSAFVDFSWWLLGVIIASTLLIGHLLKLGDQSLDVPTGAIIIFSTGASAHAAATGRLIDTGVGVAAGLLGGLLFAPLRSQNAREAVGDLAEQLAALLDRMAGDLSDEPDPDLIGGWLDEARKLRDEIERVDDKLREAEDSARLNPRVLGQPDLPPGTDRALRGGLETLEYAALSLRFLANSVTDATRVSGEESPVRHADTRHHLAAVLTMLAAAIRTYGRLVRTLPHGSEAVKSALTAELDAARHLQDRLARLLEPRSVPEGGYSEWPVRGEILCHVDRLRAGLTSDVANLVVSPERRVRPRPRMAQLRMTSLRMAPQIRATPPAGETVRPTRVYRERAKKRSQRERELTPVP